MISKSIQMLLGGGLLLAATPGLAQQDPGYILGTDDQVEISVFGQPDFSVKTRIRSDGAITLPIIGAVQASGRNAGELASAIGNTLKKERIVLKPVVNVEIATYASRAVTVLGALATPGVYPLDRRQTLSSILAQAGGVRPDGSDSVSLRRVGQETPQTIDIATLATRPDSDLLLQPGDVVFVPVAEQFFVYGQVNAPGGYPLKSNMTLRQALARAGGPTLAGSEKRVSLYHPGQPPTDADLNTVIKTGDVLFVKERVF